MTVELLMLDPRLHLVAAVLYGIAAALAVLAVVGRRDALSPWSRRFAYLALAVHTVAIIARWVAVGHGPYVSRYEVLSANAWVAVALFEATTMRFRAARSLAVFIYPSALLLMGIGLYTGPEVELLPPTFSGIWLALHVAFYFLAFGTALTAVGASVLYLLKARSPDGRLAGVPEPPELDALAYRFGGLAFAFWGIGMLAGAIWAYYAWGRFWGWDPVETWSLVTWLAFALYLHMRRFYAWKGARAAYLLIACFLLADGTLFFTSLIDGSLHAVYFR
ncbi:MAG: cytochrome c biogenesis protein CcsA [Coriobacteriia bacterium]|nr:cytochrome c biogenesis protein CcsA [Actinomycetota bacterium]MDZ4167522.1 cytochrome c biogenesis protein CcsA [Coriobacteriia bacterium]